MIHDYHVHKSIWTPAIGLLSSADGQSYSKTLDP